MKEIPLSQGFIAWVDDADYEPLAVFKWSVFIQKNRATAMRNGPRPKRSNIYMHREIMNAADGFYVDHIVHRPLHEHVVDNRRSNLRVVVPRLNGVNLRKKRGSAASPFKGVTWYEKTRRWQARITPNRKVISLGYYPSDIDAALAYDAKAVEIWGEYALTNFHVPGSSNSIFGEMP